MNQKNLEFIFFASVLFFSSAYSMKRKRDESVVTQVVPVDIVPARTVKHGYICTQYSCDQCPYSHGKEIVIENHRELHKRKKEYPSYVFTCDKCFFLARRRATFDRHMKSHELAQYICDCGESFRQSDSFERHKKLKHGVKVD